MSATASMPPDPSSASAGPDGDGDPEDGALVPSSPGPDLDAPQEEPTTAEKLRNLRWSIASNAANTVFVQYTFFGSIFVLFLKELGLRKGEMGFILSLLPFSGLLSLVVAPWVARAGYKRTYLLFWSARTVAAGFVLLTPWIHGRYGREATLVYLSVVVGLFALFRAVGMTANLPWIQEYVPDAVRGRYTATNNMVTSLTGFLAIVAGGLVLRYVAGLRGFMLLYAVAVVAGLVTVWLASHIPGGEPRPRSAPRNPLVGMARPLRDPCYAVYLGGLGLVTLATVPLGSFVPLYMREQIGLEPGNVVLLQTGALLGGVLASFLWGWAADRFGSKPVVLMGLLLRTTVPLLYMAVPRHAPTSLPVALAVATFQGIADMGWGVGSARMLYVAIVPPARRSEYMALYNAWTGLTGGTAQILAGRLLDLTQGFEGHLLGVPLDPYTPLFVLAVVFILLAFGLFNGLHVEERVGLGEFVGIFFRGNPFVAMSSMIRFHLGRGERATVAATERLGRARSPLAVEELLEALHDPRFHVRFEAVLAIARMPPDPRLIQALVELLRGTEIALAVIAAWALGRLGDPRGCGPLLEGLDAPYRSIRAHCARALGSLGCPEAGPVLLDRIQQETDRGLLMAYASALGNLRVEAGLPHLMALLDELENPGARMELALSVARILGNEDDFIRLFRAMRSDPGTAFAQAVAAIQAALDDPPESLARAGAAFAHDDLGNGVQALVQALEWLAVERFPQPVAQVLQGCRERLALHGPERPEILLLALHLLQVHSRRRRRLWVFRGAPT